MLYLEQTTVKAHPFIYNIGLFGSFKMDQAYVDFSHNSVILCLILIIVNEKKTQQTLHFLFVS